MDIIPKMLYRFELLTRITNILLNYINCFIIFITENIVSDLKLK